jgi:arginine repressor
VKLSLSIILPRPLREIKEQIMCEAVRQFGTQKLAAKNLRITEATLSRALNRRRVPKGRQEENDSTGER